MRHFELLDEAALDRVLYLRPEPFDATSPRELLAPALGATLYSPATRPQLAEDIVRARTGGAAAMVACLEDAIPDGAVAGAQVHLVEQLRALHERAQRCPLVFVRVRTPEQVTQIVADLRSADAVLTGFVLPKFTAENGADFLTSVADASSVLGRALWSMPVVETPRVMHAETRHEELLGIREVLAVRRESVLAVRVGATDLASVFGLRRPRDLTVYDVRPVADAICDIVNVLGRRDEGWCVSGPVWEYFTARERIFRTQLRETPFAEGQDANLRAQLMARDLDGLIREVVLDRANGLVGKTVIHPSHVPVVHALSVVSHEEYLDALDILGRSEMGGGVSRSAYGNKMNESSPHRAWAELTVLRARVYGVAHADASFVDLLAACVRV